MSYLDDKGLGSSLVPRNGVHRATMYQWITVAMDSVQVKIAGGDVSGLASILDELEKHLSAPTKKNDFISEGFSLVAIH